MPRTSIVHVWLASDGAFLTSLQVVIQLQYPVLMSVFSAHFWNHHWLLVKYTRKCTLRWKWACSIFIIQCSKDQHLGAEKKKKHNWAEGETGVQSSINKTFGWPCSDIEYWMAPQWFAVWGKRLDLVFSQWPVTDCRSRWTVGKITVFSKGQFIKRTENLSMSSSLTPSSREDNPAMLEENLDGTVWYPPHWHTGLFLYSGYGKKTSSSKNLCFNCIWCFLWFLLLLLCSN